MSRPTLLFLHVVGAILLFSTYLTAFTTRALAGPTRDRASLLLLASGFTLAGRARIPVLETRWLAVAGTSFILTVGIPYLMIH